ncbi:MAG: hypothetical protein GXP19_05970 [Gammaproteobacteria bacterium]|nr:hypothetical protein [Gammaproteobacteria bacterium]
MKTPTRATALLFILLFTAGCDNLPFTNPSQQPMPNDLLIGGLHRDAPLFVFSYDKAFAQRFSMPIDKAIELDPGLKAIAIEVRPKVGKIDCYLHLYLDESIKVFVPGNRKDYTKRQKAERIFAYDFTEEDSEWRWSSSSHNRVIYQAKTAGLGLSGFVRTQGYEQYKEDFLPRLNLVTLHKHCSELGSENAPSEVIFQKSGTEDYILGHEKPKKLYNENTYHFDIPPKLQQHVQQYVRYVNHFNALKNSTLNTPQRKPTIEFP